LLVVQLPGCFGKAGFVDDVVAFKDGARLVVPLIFITTLSCTPPE